MPPKWGYLGSFRQSGYRKGENGTENRSETENRSDGKPLRKTAQPELRDFLVGDLCGFQDNTARARQIPTGAPLRQIGFVPQLRPSPQLASFRFFYDFESEACLILSLLTQPAGGDCETERFRGLDGPGKTATRRIKTWRLGVY
jgi:hypothetical protein